MIVKNSNRNNIRGATVIQKSRNISESAGVDCIRFTVFLQNTVFLQKFSTIKNYQQKKNSNFQKFFSLVFFYYPNLIQLENIAIILALGNLFVGQNFAGILTNESSPWNFLERLDSPAFFFCWKKLQLHRNSPLNDSIPALGPTTTRCVALEKNRRILKIVFRD